MGKYEVDEDSMNIDDDAWGGYDEPWADDFDEPYPNDDDNLNWDWD